MIIELNQGKTCVIDDEDGPLVAPYKWTVVKRNDTLWHAQRQYQKNGKVTTIMMHRLILGLTDRKIEVDHKDGDGLNNRRSNLRKCTRAQNGKNRRKSLNCSTPYKGVRLLRGKFEARITADGVQIYLGTFGHR